MVAIRVAVDKKASLLAGLDLGSEVTVDVTPESIGADLWPRLVDMLQTHSTQPYLSHVMVAGPTAEHVRDALAGYVTTRDAEVTAAMQGVRDGMARLREAAQQPPVSTWLKVSTTKYHQNDIAYNASFHGWKRVLPYVSLYGVSANTPEAKAELAELTGERDRIIEQSRLELEELNRAALETVLPELREAYAKEQAEAKEQEEREAAEEAERAAKRKAKRLETGYWETETSDYNSRRYGPPWCARVTGVKSGAELVYEWGDSTARHGSAGLLRVPCKPGEIVAWGQKDHRKPAASDHYLMLMLEDGGMQEIDKTAAYRRLTGS